MNKFIFLLITILFYFTPIFSQVPYDVGSKVRVHSLGDVQHLNFFTATDNLSTIMSGLTHQLLYQIDPVTYEHIPLLAKERAKAYEKNGLLHLDFEIREEAKWDNEKDITGHDVVFSLKIVFTPHVETVGRLRPYLDYIKDIIVDKNNPKKFTVICKEPYMSAETSLANTLLILPSSIYDPESILSNYALVDLMNRDLKRKFEEDINIKEFASIFNSDSFKFEINNGSGAYQFISWNTNENILFQRKKDWWGDQVTENKNSWFEAYPEFIEYVTITDLTTATIATKKGEIDAMQAMPNKVFRELEKEKNENLQLFTPPLFSYDYIGMNSNHKILSDKNVRYALSHLMDVDEVIDRKLYGYGGRCLTIVHPIFKERINPDLSLIKFNIKKAKKLLKRSKWKDTNKDGILDKIIDGERTELSLTILVNNGNNRRKTAAIVLKEAAKKAGINIDIRILEWASFLDKIQKKDTELYVLGWVASPLESDPKQIWHTQSINGGSNYTSFGNEVSDKVIEKLRTTTDYKKRIPLYFKLQKIIHEERPYIFLMNQLNRVVISSKFKNAYGSGNRQGFMPQHLKLAD